MSGPLSRIRTVCGKEVIDNLRDRRSLSLAFVYPLMGPILLGLMIALVSRMFTMDPTRETNFRIIVEGRQHAPSLEAYAKDFGVVLQDSVPNPRPMVNDGIYNTAIIIPPGFEQSLADGRKPQVEILVNSAKLAAVLEVARVAGFLRGYSQEIASKRLREAGIDPAVAEPLEIKQTSINPDSRFTDFFLFMVPPFIIFSVFLGGVYLAIDTTSGERERGSLEPLLANPVARWEFMMGKFLAALLFTFMAVLVQLLAFKLVFMSAGGAIQNLEAKLGAHVILALLVTVFPLMMLATVIQIVIASVTRSFKEAQTYLGLLPLLPALPGIILVFVPVRPSAAMMMIPGFNQTVLMGQIIREENISALYIALSIGATTAAALVLLWFCAKLYNREQLLWAN